MKVELEGASNKKKGSKAGCSGDVEGGRGSERPKDIEYRNIVVKSVERDLASVVWSLSSSSSVVCVIVE